MIKLRKSKFVLIILLFLKFNLIGQSNSELMTQVSFIAHADYGQFFVDNDSCFKREISNYYDIAIVDSNAYLESLVFKIIPKAIDCNSCIMLLVYDKSEKRFYRLKGFLNNDFTEFYNRVILDRYPLFKINGKVKKKTLNNILKELNLNGVNLKKLHKKYYKKYKSSLYDDTSCFRKSTIALPYSIKTNK